MYVVTDKMQNIVDCYLDFTAHRLGIPRGFPGQVWDFLIRGLFLNLKRREQCKNCKEVTNSNFESKLSNWQ